MKFKRLKTDFKDKRGTIMDIFYKENIQHVAIIKSKPNVTSNTPNLHALFRIA